jgi:CHAT domain-containing protein
VKLTIGAFEILHSEAKVGRAEALRRAMLGMIESAGTESNPGFESHPLFWAPFVVVGEGAPSS